MIGVFNSYIVLANASSLKFHKSSKEPPPRAKIIVLKWSSSTNFKVEIIFKYAFFPWTGIGKTITLQTGKRSFKVRITSINAALGYADKTAILLG